MADITTVVVPSRVLFNGWWRSTGLVLEGNLLSIPGGTAEPPISGNCLELCRFLKSGLWLVLFVLLSTFICIKPLHAARIVYKAEGRYSGLPELFLADTRTPGTTIQLNRPIPKISNNRFSNGVLSYAISPDGDRVAYSADQTNVGDNDLYLVEVVAPGKWTRVGNLPAGWLELWSKFSPDSQKLAFTATSGGCCLPDHLYLVDMADPGTATLLNGNLVEHGYISSTGFEFTPDGTHIVYAAAEIENTVELYAVSLSNPGGSVRLNAPGGSVGDSYEGRFRILPDSRRVIYSAVWKNPGVRELHIVSLDHPGQPVTLNAPMQPDGYVFDFDVSPDGNFVTYIADQDTDGKPEVYLVDIKQPGIATKISGSIQGGAGLVKFTPDNQFILYTGDEERDAGSRDLYSVAVENPASRQRVNAPLPASADVGVYASSPDGSQVVYRPDRQGEYPTELMLARLDTPGTAMLLNQPFPEGYLEQRPLAFDPNGENFVYLASETAAGSIQELFFSKVNDAGSSVRLNEPLPFGGIVTPTPDAFAFLPDNPAFHINAGMSDAWYDPFTNGQGFLITVLPQIEQIFLAWFTYDIERPLQDVGAQLGEPGHRWLTAQGGYHGDEADLEIYLTEGGVFDSEVPASQTRTEPIGSIRILWKDCENAVLDYELSHLGLKNRIKLQRIVRDNVELCAALATSEL